MEVWKDELYHYGVRGMKWKKRTDSGTDELSADIRYWRRHASEDGADGARYAYETRKMMEGGASPHQIRERKQWARNVLKGTRYELKMARTQEAIAGKRKASGSRFGRTARHRGNSYIRRVLS